MGDPHLEETSGRQLGVVSERGWAGELEREKSKGSGMGHSLPRGGQRERGFLGDGNIFQNVRTKRGWCPGAREVEEGRWVRPAISAGKSFQPWAVKGRREDVS